MARRHGLERASLVFVLGASLLLAGCPKAPNAADIKPIQQIYADRLSRLYIGMPLSEFRSAFPEAYPQGQNGGTTAYELSHKQVIIDKRRRLDQAVGIYQPRNVVSDQSLWFYFYTDRLAQWGRPGDWPARPDIIIEQRSR